MKIIDFFQGQLALTAKNPSRIKHIFSWKKWNLLLSVRQEWSIDEKKLLTRKYSSYEQYKEHQKAKLDSIKWLNEYDGSFHLILKNRLVETGISFNGSKVLCLAARIGTEVRAFIDLNAFAVGIDLNPGTNNKFVLHGDFHNIQFTDGSVDIVFTNSMDHAYDLSKLMQEVNRILKPGGIFIAEVAVGSEKGTEKGFYEALWWESWLDLANAIEEVSHFSKLSDRDFDLPWNGKQIIFKKPDVANDKGAA